MGRIILPINYTDFEGYLAFLAGPIRSAPEWQDRAIEILLKLKPELNIACPSWFLRPEYLIGNKPKPEEETQVPWETYHLRKAGREKGAILFWLAKEKKHDCRYSYARTTRGEFGEWLTRADVCGAYIAVGIEEGFEGARYWKRRILIDKDFGDIPVFSTLEDTCKETIRLINRRTN